MTTDPPSPQVACPRKRLPAILSALFLLGMTALGCLVAVWTRCDVPDVPSFLCKPVLAVIHVLLLGTWVASWLLFWKHALGGLGGRLFGLGVAVLVAIAAEACQIWIPGHICDVVGVSCNLVGAALAVLLLRGHLRRPGPE